MVFPEADSLRYWHKFWEDFLHLDPEFFEAYLEFSSVPWTKSARGEGSSGGVLEPKVRNQALPLRVYLPILVL